MGDSSDEAMQTHPTASKEEDDDAQSEKGQNPAMLTITEEITPPGGTSSPFMDDTKPPNNSNNLRQSLAASHPEADTLGFVLDVPDHRAKKFSFKSKSLSGGDEYDVIHVIVPEVMVRKESGYGLRLWPSAILLAWYLFENRDKIKGKRILELGAGTALPGVTAAMCGAEEVILTDSMKFPKCLDACKTTAEINGVLDKVKVMGLTWGLFSNNVLLTEKVDLLIGADCFFDPAVFEDLISTVSFILEGNEKATFLTTYQERSSDWSIEHLLRKWGLKCKHISLKDLANKTRVNFGDIMGNYTIHLLQISLI